MGDNFTFKYLFDLYPHTDFTEEWVLCQTIEEIPNTSNNIMTSEKWADVRSSVRRERIVQSHLFQNYEVKIVVSRNIGFPRMEYCDFIECTRYYSSNVTDTFYIYDVSVQYDKVPQSMNYVVTLQFKQEREKILNHLTSDNALAYKTDTSDGVNEVQYEVNSAAFSFNNVEFYRGTTPFLGEFKVPLNNLTNNFTTGDLLYMHTDNEEFNALTDVSGDNINFAEYKTKDSDYVYFVCSANPVAVGWSYTVANVILDNNPDWRDLPSGITPIAKTISPVIYTFLEPKYSHITEMKDGQEKPDGKQENQKGIEKDICMLKAFLTEDEKWKAEYLNYADHEDILISLDNYDDIIPSQTKDIITVSENNNLIDVFEYDIKITYNVKSVSTNR